MSLGSLIGLPSIGTVELVVAGLAVAGACAFSIGLTHKVDDATLEKSELACTKAAADQQATWQRTVDAANAAAAAQSAADQKRYQDAIDQHSAAEVALAKSATALRGQRDGVQRSLDALKAAGATCTVRTAAGTDTWDSNRVGAALEWVREGAGLAVEVALRADQCHTAAVEALAATKR